MTDGMIGGYNDEEEEERKKKEGLAGYQAMERKKEKGEERDLKAELQKASTIRNAAQFQVHVGLRGL